VLRRFWLFVVTGLWPVYAVAQHGLDGRMNGNNMRNGYGYMHGRGHMVDFWGGHIVTWTYF
jgi:hypothetical protein